MLLARKSLTKGKHAQDEMTLKPTSSVLNDRKKEPMCDERKQFPGHPLQIVNTHLNRHYPPPVSRHKSHSDKCKYQDFFYEEFMCIMG